MSTQAAQPETLAPGQHLVQLYQNLWVAESKLFPMPTSLESVIGHLPVTTAKEEEPLEIFTEAIVMEVGNRAIKAYWSDQQKQVEHKAAQIDKQKSVASLKELIADLSGKQVKVSALGDGDCSIYHVWNAASGEPHIIDYVPKAEGTITPNSFHYFRQDSFLELRPSHFSKRLLGGRYHVNVINRFSGEPQVDLTIED